jgi:hypothetical protein
MKLYVDGVLVATVSHSGSIPINEGDLVFGAVLTAGIAGGFSDAQVADARLWSTVRSINEIVANSDIQIGPQSGLVGMWRFADLTDASGNGATIALLDGANLLRQEGFYSAYACTGDYYERVGYDSVMQIGVETFRIDDEKMIRFVHLEANPLEQSTPSMVECDVAYGAQPSCMTWTELEQKEYACVTAYSTAQHAANNTRPDNRFSFNVWRRGIYLSARIRIGGLGGGGKFGALWFEVKPWGQSDH